MTSKSSPTETQTLSDEQTIIRLQNEIYDLYQKSEALYKRIGHHYDFLRMKGLLQEFNEWDFKDMPEKEQD